MKLLSNLNGGVGKNKLSFFSISDYNNVMNTTPLAHWLFGSLGVAAIASGGLLSAFWSRWTSRRLSWAVAYIVLVAGLLQLGFAYGLAAAVPNPPVGILVGAFLAYNLGNAAVLVGTILKDVPRCRGLVDIGGCLLSLAMILLIYTAWDAPGSWQLMIFYAAVIVILITMPIGLVLSRRN